MVLIELKYVPLFSKVDDLLCWHICSFRMKITYSFLRKSKIYIQSYISPYRVDATCQCGAVMVVKWDHAHSRFLQMKLMRDFYNEVTLWK